MIALGPRVAHAQARPNAYVFLGAGAADIGGGAEWLIRQGPIGIGGEIGLGNLLAAGVTVSYHLGDRTRPSRVDPFLAAAFTSATDLNSVVRGVSVGAGLTYWMRRRIGLRLDGFRFLPPPGSDRLENARYWGVRSGLAIALH